MYLWHMLLFLTFISCSLNEVVKYYTGWVCCKSPLLCATSRLVVIRQTYAIRLKRHLAYVTEVLDLPVKCHVKSCDITGSYMYVVSGFLIFLYFFLKVLKHLHIVI